MSELACLVNGEISTWVPAADRGLAYGDGLFETFAVQSGRPRFWQAHMDRLARGCDILGIVMPAQEILLREVQTVAAAAPLCVVKLILTRGVSGRGYAPREGRETTRVVSAFEFPAGVGEATRVGVKARICEHKLSLQPALAGIKHLNRLEQVLAAREMSDYPAMEGILTNQEGYIISGVSANLFLVHERNLLTPRMDRSGVRGVLRNLLIKDFKTRCELRRITPDMLDDAQEVFLASSVRGIIPVTRIDDHEWTIGNVTRELQDWFKGRKESS